MLSHIHKNDLIDILGTDKVKRSLPVGFYDEQNDPEDFLRLAKGVKPCYTRRLVMFEYEGSLFMTNYFEYTTWEATMEHMQEYLPMVQVSEEELSRIRSQITLVA